METEIVKILLNGGAGLASIAVLIVIVLKLMPAQTERFLKMLEAERSEWQKVMASERAEALKIMGAQRHEFLAALKEERDQFAKDRDADREVRHYLGGVVNALCLSLSAAGVKFIVPAPSAKADASHPHNPN